MPLASPATSLDGDLYTWITGVAQHTPAVLDSAVRVWSDFGLGLFALLMLAAWWRSRAGDPVRIATALCAPCGRGGRLCGQRSAEDGRP